MKFRLVEEKALSEGEGLEPKLSMAINRALFPRQHSTNKRGNGNIVRAMLVAKIKKEVVDANTINDNFVIHHINGDHNDNRISNVCLIRNSIHNGILNRASKLFVDELEDELKSHGIASPMDEIEGYFLRGTTKEEDSRWIIEDFISYKKGRNDYIERGTRDYIKDYPHIDNEDISKIQCIKVSDLLDDDNLFKFGFYK